MKSWVKSPVLHKPGLVVHTCLSIWEAEAGRLQGHPRLHNEFKATLSHMRSCLKKTKRLSDSRCDDFIQESVVFKRFYLAGFGGIHF